MSCRSAVNTNSFRRIGLVLESPIHVIRINIRRGVDPEMAMNEMARIDRLLAYLLKRRSVSASSR